MRGVFRTVLATRYVLPFREGGSVPALVEGDDLGLYVVKLRGAGQGPKTLIAELVAGELARTLGLLVPELVLVTLDASIAESEPDPELADPLAKSVGENLGLDYLPGSITFDALVGPPPTASIASRVVLFDAFVLNVDRTPKNPNLLSWHAGLWLIDHGAALYFHHGWQPTSVLDSSRDPFSEVRQHVLLRWASELADAARHLTDTLTDAVCERVVAQIPAGWLADDRAFGGESELRAAYLAWLRARRDAIPLLLEEALGARASLV
jgi:hypothetical protein